VRDVREREHVGDAGITTLRTDVAEDEPRRRAGGLPKIGGRRRRAHVDTDRFAESGSKSPERAR
jgi:hypothetical protein